MAVKIAKSPTLNAYSMDQSRVFSFILTIAPRIVPFGHLAEKEACWDKGGDEGAPREDQEGGGTGVIAFGGWKWAGDEMDHGLGEQ